MFNLDRNIKFKDDVNFLDSRSFDDNETHGKDKLKLEKLIDMLMYG